MRWTGTSQGQPAWRWWIPILVSAAAVSASVLGFEPETRRPAQDQVVSLPALPAEAQQTRRLIQSGGPFPYAKDGVVFGNRERLLPNQTRGYYREYTVPTPGSRDRGARRLVCGGQQPTAPDACYYTDDHYASFRLIAQ